MNTEPLIIKAPGIVDAWRTATEQIIEHGERFNLSVHITNPTQFDEADVARYCHRRVAPSIRQSVYDVANTIFPKETPRHQGDLQSFFDYYRARYERGQRRHPTAWGTYFLRLIAFGKSKQNQLLKVLKGMTEWNSKPRAAFVVHLSSTDLDNPRPLGAPCWQYGQFLRSDSDQLSFTAVYRSHDYFQKALGNFVGLSRLLRFVCNRSGMNPGTLTCISTFANVQDKRSQTKQLLKLL